MPTSQLNTLESFRRYQRVLIFGGGIVATVLVMLMLFAEVRTTLLKHRALLLQAFGSERALLLKEIDAREDAFRIVLIGAEIVWREGQHFDLAGVESYRQHERQWLLDSSSALRPQWVFGTGHEWVGDEELARFFSLATEVGRGTSLDRMVKGEVISAYFYSLQHNIVGIIPSPDLDARSTIAQDRSHFLRMLTRDIDQRISVSHVEGESHHPLYWLPPYTNPYSGERVLRIAGPIMDRGTPFAALVMEYAVLNLPRTAVPEPSRGAYLILSAQGETITASESNYSKSAGLDEKLLDQVLRSSEERRVEHFSLDGLVLADALGETEWRLVYYYSWRDLLASVGWQIVLQVGLTLVVLLMIWIVLLVFKLRVLRPLIRRSQQVFESEQLNRTLMETAPVGLGLLIADTGEFLLKSRSMVQMQTRIDLQGQCLIAELVACYQRNRTRLRESSSGQLIQEDLTIPSESNSAVSLSVGMTSLKYRKREAVVVAFTDITTQKQLEVQLLNAKDAADRSNAAKSAFLAAMSHEIRTPLNAVMGNLELLAYAATPEQRDRLEIVRKSSDNLLAIVSDVLDFSKIEAGELLLENIEFDAVEVGATTLALFTPMAQAKGLTLRGELGDAIACPMMGDPTRFSQILNNLLSNAIKFTEQGEVILRLKVDVRGKQLWAEVEDTGIGMSEVQILDAFRAFSQTDATISRRYGGTGLGLTLCLRLAEAMGGRLSVRSSQGEGTLFRIFLPLGERFQGVAPVLFDRQRIVLLTAARAWQQYLVAVLENWNLQISSFQHPAQIDEETLAGSDALIIWGERDTWHPRDEENLVDGANWLIDCRADGPVEPLLAGHVLKASSYGLKGVARALEHILLEEPLSSRAVQPQASTIRLKVLVAEDNPVNGRLFEEQLQMLGCDVEVVPDGLEALAWLEHRLCDLLITDLSMPRLDGYGLAKAVRQRWPQLPVIAATASITVQEQDRCRGAGIERVLGKPLSLSGLRKALEDIGRLQGSSVAPSTDLRLLDNRDLPQGMEQVFRQFCRSCFADIRLSLEEQDDRSLAHHLHSLKGALGVYQHKEECRRIVAIEARISRGTEHVRECAEQLLQDLEVKLSLDVGHFAYAG